MIQTLRGLDWRLTPNLLLSVSLSLSSSRHHHGYFSSTALPHNTTICGYCIFLNYLNVNNLRFITIFYFLLRQIPNPVSVSYLGTSVWFLTLLLLVIHQCQGQGVEDSGIGLDLIINLPDNRIFV